MNTHDNARRVATAERPTSSFENRLVRRLFRLEKRLDALEAKVEKMGDLFHMLKTLDLTESSIIAVAVFPGDDDDEEDDEDDDGWLSY